MRLNTGVCIGEFVNATVRYHFKTGQAEVVLVIVACRFQSAKYRYLFGLDGQNASHLIGLKAGDELVLERQAAGITLNRLPVRRFYQRTLKGMREFAEAGWRRLTL